MKIDLLEGFSHLTNVYFSTRKYLYLGLRKTKIYIDLTSWAVFFRSGFMTLEGRYCLWLRILRTVVQQRHPESLQASSSRPTPSLRSLPISL